MALIMALPCWAQPLAEDSSRFARYWELAETGDTTGASTYLLSLTDSSRQRTSQMAGFLMGWLAYQQGDYAGVAVQLDLGAPPELADHVLFLQADALEQLDQAALAASLWEELSRDTTSVFASEAFFRLAGWAKVTGDLEGFFHWAAKHRTHPTDEQNRQRLDLVAAEILASQDRHAEAVEILYNAELAGSGTESAVQIRKALSEYRKRHDYTPRPLTEKEIERELLDFERARAFQRGLHRVHELMQSRQGTELSELLTHAQALFESGLRRYRKAVESFQNHFRRFPGSRYRGMASYYQGRSAYLTDQDSVAICALTDASNQDDDLATAQQALELLGILHLDRGRPEDAEAAFLRWETLSRGSRTESDCLWRLGWAQWESARFETAAETWQRLFELDSTSAYAPVSLYWRSRALRQVGRSDEATHLMESLHWRFPYSYYAVIESSSPDTLEPLDVPLLVPTLDELWLSGGEHKKRLCLLAAMRLPDLALREWPAARRELSAEDGLSWWEAQLHVWNGDRTAAMRVIRTELPTYIRTAGARPTDFLFALYPLDFDPKIIEQAAQHEIDPYFLFALICQESHFDPIAISPVGAIGLMQLMPETAKKEARKLGIPYSFQKLKEPDYNLRLGVAHLAELMQEYSGNSVLALAAYNAGENVANEWQAEFGARERDEFIELIPYRETRLFIKRIFEHQAAYRRIYPEAGRSLLATPSQPHASE